MKSKSLTPGFSHLSSHPQNEYLSLVFLLPEIFCACTCCVHAQLLSRVQLFATLWTVACRAPLSLGFFRQEYWSGLPFPISGIFPTQGSNPCLLRLQLCRMTLYLLSHIRVGLYIYLYPLAPASLEGGVYTVSYTFLCLFNSVLKTF